MVLPLELHADCLVQIDHALNDLGQSSQFTLSAAELIDDGYLPTRELLHHVSTLAGLELQVISFTQLHQLGSSDPIACLALTQDGAAFVLTLQPNQSITLQAFNEQQQVIQSFSGHWDGLQLELDLNPQIICLVVRSHAVDAPSQPELRFVMAHFWRHQRMVWQILGVAILLALLSLAPALGFQAFADKILPNHALQSLSVIVVLLLLAAAATSVLQCFHDMLESTLFAQFQNGLAQTVFRRLLAMPMTYLDARKTGDLTKLFDQVQEVANFLVKQLLAAVVATLSLLVVLPLLISYSLSLSLLVMTIGVLMAATVALGLQALRQRIQIAYQFDAQFQSKLIEACKGIRTIKALGQEGRFQDQLKRAHSHQLYGDFDVARLTHRIGAWVHWQSQLITIAVIFFGAQAVFSQQMTIGQLIAFNMLANNLVQPLLSLVLTAQGWEHFRLAHNKLHELTPPQAKHGPVIAPHTQGLIEFQHLWFAYPKAPDEPVLQDINLRIHPGETIGIVGASGSGKSTLAQLLLGFYQPTRGAVVLDGLDVRQWPEQQLRTRIAWVSQETFLFNTSVFNNVHLGRLSANVAEVQTALEQAECTPFITQLSAGAGTLLDEDGQSLSGGQRQRLALARALVRNSDIMIFDEATSALDPATERSLLKSIEKTCATRTVIMIAHRLHTLLHCDRMVVLEQGRITGVGTHAALMATHTHYQHLWQALDQTHDD